MCERAEFPCAKVAGQKDDALSASDSLVVIFKAFIGHQTGNIRGIQLMKMAEFHQQAAQVAEAAAKYAIALVVVEVGHRHLQVPQSRLPLTARDMETDGGDRLGARRGRIARHPTEEFEQCIGGQVFDDAFNALAHPWYLRIL